MRDQDFVKVAKALADPTRRRMLDALRRKGELNCSQLCALFPLRQPTVSHHVKTLKDAGLVTCRTDGPFTVLTPVESRLKAFTDALAPPAPARPRARRTK